MKYSDAAAKYFDIQARLGNETAPLNLLIEARAIDELDPGKLDVAPGGTFTYAGAALPGAGLSIPPLLDAPGFFVRPMITDGSTSFLVSTSSPPSALLNNFVASDISNLLGDANIHFLQLIVGMLRDKLAGAGLLPADEVNRAADVANVGLIVVPAARSAMVNYYKGLPDRLLAPVFPVEIKTASDKAWSDVITAFDEARKAYFNRAYDDAARLAAASAANVELWNGIYSAVEKVAAPAIMLGLAPASDNYSAVFDLLSWKTWALVGAAALALGVAYVATEGRPVAAAVKKITKG